MRLGVLRLSWLFLLHGASIFADALTLTCLCCGGHSNVSVVSQLCHYKSMPNCDRQWWPLAHDSTMCFQVSYTAIIVWCKKGNGSLESNTLLVWGVDIWWRFIIREFTVHEYISLVYVLHIQCTVHMAVLPVRGGVTPLISWTPQGWSGVPAGLNPRVHQDMWCWRQLPPGCESGLLCPAWKWMRKSQSSRLGYHMLCMRVS